MDKSIKDHVEGLEPHSYLGDAAEAIANTAQVVFPSITARLMCFAHVYKVREQKRLHHHLQMYAPMGEKQITRVSLVVDGVITLPSRRKNDSFFDYLLPNDLITY